jgi:aldehyde dehydrogenase (NAD+)
MDVQTYRNYINGKWVASSSVDVIADTNPANFDDVVGYFQQSNRKDVKKAIDAAGKAFENWKSVPAPKRAKMLFEFIQRIRERIKELAHVLTLEQGKPLAESRAEIERAIKEMEFMLGEGTRFGGVTVPSEREDCICYTVRCPLGVVAAITPWNFPFVIPVRKIFPALLTGNAVVFKPASFTPMSGLKIIEILAGCDLPPGVVNFVTGSGEIFGDEIAGNPLVKGISFTGSTEVGRKIFQQVSGRMARLQLEMGGKNAAIVLDDADLGRATDEIVSAAFSCTGQRCTAISRVIVVKSFIKKFGDTLIDKVKALKVGDGMLPDTKVGPMIDKLQLDRIMKYVNIGRREGAKLLCGGERLAGREYEKGYFFKPSVFGNVTSSMRIAQEEIFGPVLSIIPVSGFEEALDVANSVRYGLAAAIYTSDLGKACKFVGKMEAGMLHVNMPTLSEAHLPFGGMKESGFGPYSVGNTAIDFYTQVKSVYVNYRA